jgi:hypothetical protein
MEGCNNADKVPPKPKRIIYVNSSYFTFIEVVNYSLNCLPIKLHMLSIGDKSGDRADHERVSAVASTKNSPYENEKWSFATPYDDEAQERCAS